jgi:hypothetical protein
MRSFIATAIAVLAAVASVSAHGYLSSPPCRGCEKATYQVDDLKSPNTRGLCRGEPAGPVTKVTGNQITLGFTITAPHVGPCAVSILDTNLGNEQQIDTRMDCAAPGKVAPWTVTIPKGITGRKVLRWTWEGCHISPCEKYEQCVDIDIVGNGGGSETPSPSTPGTLYGFGVSQPSPAPAPETSTNYGAPQPSTQAPVTPNFPALPVPEVPAVPEVPGYASAPVPKVDQPATPAAGGQCTNGAFSCNGQNLGICNFGEWIWIACPVGTTCISSGTDHRCAQASAY